VRGMVQAARKHARSAIRLPRQGHTITAGAAYHPRGALLPLGKLFVRARPEQFIAAMEATNECWKKAAPLVNPADGADGDPVRGREDAGVFAQARGVAKPPIVSSSGRRLDQGKALTISAEHILKRGSRCSPLTARQGRLSTQVKLRPDFEVPIRP